MKSFSRPSKHAIRHNLCASVRLCLRRVQVSALKPNGERVTMTIGFADMLSDEELRDPLSYHYEVRAAEPVGAQGW